MAKMLYRKDTGEILGVHIFGLHAADLIHEASNAIATGQTVQVRARAGGPRALAGLKGAVAWRTAADEGGAIARRGAMVGSVRSRSARLSISPDMTTIQHPTQRPSTPLHHLKHPP
jgi:hypothetical protein